MGGLSFREKEKEREREKIFELLEGKSRDERENNFIFLYLFVLLSATQKNS